MFHHVTEQCWLLLIGVCALVCVCARACLRPSGLFLRPRGIRKSSRLSKHAGPIRSIFPCASRWKNTSNTPAPWIYSSRMPLFFTPNEVRQRQVEKRKTERKVCLKTGSGPETFDEDSHLLFRSLMAWLLFFFLSSSSSRWCLMLSLCQHVSFGCLAFIRVFCINNELHHCLPEGFSNAKKKKH